MGIVMMQPIMKFATGTEEIVAIQMPQWNIVLNVFVWIQTLQVKHIKILIVNA